VSALPRARLDVREVACPLTWVRTRIALQRIAAGEVLEVLLGEGEPAENVPRSAEEDGHRVLRLEVAPDEGPGTWRAWLERGSGAEERTWP
jgi:tRNA 2-thiouridine synthesizing protein A